ncbi:MAG: AmmeMemoRadiSam system protein B [Candidatus Riflebacteria bacterium]|nr:AmmeMemoRadiSam system protein B [Candidatus Riflebacteria bacterium]
MQINLSLLTVLFIVLLGSCTFASGQDTSSPVTGIANIAINPSADIRAPAVAGQFYPADAKELSTIVDTYLTAAKPARTAASEARLVGLITPHAGYQFSGPTAATAFKSLMNQKFDHVFLLGVDHHSGLPTMSVWPRGAFDTPLGMVPVDATLSASLLASGAAAFTDDPAGHIREHSLEVELPFYLKTIGSVPAVFVSVGGPLENGFKLGRRLIEMLPSLPGRTLIIASSDWSHYHDIQTARELDERGLVSIRALDAEDLAAACRLGKSELCGINGVLALLTVMKNANAQVTLLERTDSSAGSGDRERVVGYAAVLFEANIPSVSPKTQITPATSAQEVVPMELKQEALTVIRQTLESVLSGGKVPAVTFKHPRFKDNCGVFVTLKKAGELRGCIGLIEGIRPLGEGIQDMAVAAATEDSRFSPMTASELKEVSIEVSILSPMIPVKDLSEIQVGRDGVLLRAHGRSGVFLPQVATEQGWDRDTFLTNLCYKAGLPPGSHKQPDAKLYRFTADVFGEKE